MSAFNINFSHYTLEEEADYAAQMMFNHLRRVGQPFVTPEVRFLSLL
jgi:hypothetical protein